MTTVGVKPSIKVSLDTHYRPVQRRSFQAISWQNKQTTKNNKKPERASKK